MPIPKTASNAGPGAKSKAASSSEAATSALWEKDTSDVTIATLAGGKPDKKAYDAQQDEIKKEIDALQVKLSAARDKISLATGGSGPANDRRTELRAELDEIRGQQSDNKLSRGKIFDQLKAHQESLQKQIKDLQAAKSKIPFKTVAEVDAHIAKLDKQVESGTMKLAEEKRALAEISTSRRSRRAVEGFEAGQASIDSTKQAIEELKKELDDPEAKAASEKFEAIKAELDELQKQGDEAAAGRKKLFSERDSIQAQLTELFEKKRSLTQQYREANDRHWQKINEERQRRAEKARLQRTADEKAKKKEVADRLLEEAQVPAFQAQVEDCQTLIDHLSGKSSGNVTLKTASAGGEKAAVAGVPKLELRKVEVENIPEGSVVRKKKGDDEENYFVAKSKSKGKKTPKAESPATPSTPSANLQLPLPTLSALLALSIPPPASSADVPRVIEDLQTKKAWFEANQERVTAENIAKAKARIEQLNQEEAKSSGDWGAPPKARTEKSSQEENSSSGDWGATPGAHVEQSNQEAGSSSADWGGSTGWGVAPADEAEAGKVEE
ncbi:hypothetical protein EST38_g618 [Candolleomyces aberdarensis]|uniref:Nuclear segregation protein n=1 Tax=Candolleomyces aberdarensis TaxID=2316362 RepID=A0A4Q2DZ91_9AGAR|nr:hypothetical protein EST38_g618 [Candolleomyces aberdarensis]